VDSEELVLLAARWEFGLIRPHDLHEVAGELLERGLDKPALIELFSLSKEAAPWEGPALFDQALRELGAPSAAELRDGRVVARLMARAILGGETPREVCQQASRYYLASGYRSADLGGFYALDDEYGSLDHGLSFSGRTEQQIDEDARTFARDLLGAGV